MAPPHNEYRWFVAVRLAGVAVRPLVLLVALKLSDDGFATNYALIITAVMSSFVIYANQNHRDLYNFFLDRSSPRQGLGGKNAVHNYLDGVAIHMVVFTPAVMFLVWLWVETLWLFLLTMPLVMIEKYYDDHQRALIYKRAYSRWSLHSLFRLTLVLVMVAGFGSVSVALYTAATIACFITYLTYWDRTFLRALNRWLTSLRRLETSIILQRAKRYAKDYLSDYVGAQIFTILAINLMLIDRFFVREVFSGTFAQYIFAVNIFSMISVFHNIFYFTRIRNKLISQSYPVFATVFSLRNIGVPTVLALGALASFPVMQMLGLLDGTLGWEVLCALAGVHFIAAITLVLREFAFWRVKRYWLVLMDIVVISMIFAALLISSQSLAAIPFVFAIGLLLRGATLSWLCSTTHENIRLPKTGKVADAI